MMMSTILPKAKAYLILLFILAYLVKPFFPQGFLTDVMAIAAVLVFAVGLADIKPLNRNLVCLLLFCSGFLIWSGSGVFDWSSAIIENAGIVTLLLTVPMLGSILYYAPYEGIILALANRYIRSSFAFYVVAMGLVAFFGSFMTLASVPFAHQLVKPIANQYPEEVFFRALSRGLIVNLFWAPNLITVAVVLQYVPISWPELAVVGFNFCVLSFLAACLFGKCEIVFCKSAACPESDVSERRYNALSPEAKQHLFSLVLQVIVILAAVLIVNQYMKIGIYAAVAIVALSLPLLFALTLRTMNIYKQRLTHYLSSVLPGMCNEFMLFLTIGFFGYVLGKTMPLDVLRIVVTRLDGVTPEVLILLVIIVIAGVAIMGIHPIITISTLALALTKVEFGLSNMQLAISFITGYTMYLMLSPFSSMVMVMSGLSKRNVYQMGLKLNWFFAVLLTLLVTGVIRLWVR